MKKHLAPFYPPQAYSFFKRIAFYINVLILMAAVCAISSCRTGIGGLQTVRAKPHRVMEHPTLRIDNEARAIYVAHLTPQKDTTALCKPKVNRAYTHLKAPATYKKYGQPHYIGKHTSSLKSDVIINKGQKKTNPGTPPSGRGKHQMYPEEQALILLIVSFITGLFPLSLVAYFVARKAYKQLLLDKDADPDRLKMAKTVMTISLILFILTLVLLIMFFILFAIFLAAWGAGTSAGSTTVTCCR